MIKTAKAFADQPEIKSNIKEFKVVSTGTERTFANAYAVCGARRGDRFFRLLKLSDQAVQGVTYVSGPDNDQASAGEGMRTLAPNHGKGAPRNALRRPA